jgi:hypothetical protein
MRSPYIVGRWVRGSEHYGRQSLIDYLLTNQDTAFWVVGTRRMGKTSLLRQIEWSVRRSPASLVPVFWDLQGCVTIPDLAAELILSLDDASVDLESMGVPLEDLRSLTDPIPILRLLNRSLNQAQKQLLLLVDEAEVLTRFAISDAVWLERLRKVAQEGHQRTIIASTKLLSMLVSQSAGWVTTPFLLGFQLVNLWPLSQDGAQKMVRQSQASIPVTVDDLLAEQIVEVTNSHPYLIQLLCQRLFVDEGDDSGHLRPIQEEDLAVDAILGALFANDFQHLTSTEQIILLAAAQAGSLPDEGLAKRFPTFQSAELVKAFSTLHELGHLRRQPTGWTVGNEFLRRWIDDHFSELLAGTESPSANRNSAQAAMGPERSGQPKAGTYLPRPTIPKPRDLESELDLFNAVTDFFHEIRHLVEQDDGHRLLMAMRNGQPGLRSEEEVQIALKHWLRPMCQALNVDLERETLTGRGLLDFKFSLGRDKRCLVEVKLLHSNSILEGVDIQLPIYLLAEKANYGIYVPIIGQADGYESTLEKLERLAARRAETHHMHISVIDIRAWKPVSASKATTIEELQRYVLAPGSPFMGSG